MKTVVRYFGDRERERLVRLFHTLGNDNVHEAEAARGKIESLFREFGKAWADLVQLLGGTVANIRTDLADDIVALGSSDPHKRAQARHGIFELLARHRKSWNDLAGVLYSHSNEAWACNPSADDPPRSIDLIGLLYHLLEEYVAVKPHEYTAIVLWMLHTHVFNRFMVTPRLAIRSPVADCGKTTLLDILSRLTARPEKLDNVTVSTLYRLIDAAHPTMLIDEADNLGLGLQPNGRLRAVFNSGHRHGGSVSLTENGKPRKFSTHAPLALALPEMRGLPRTLNSRSITITMERSRRKLMRFDVLHPDPALDAAYTQILLWKNDAELDPDPEIPAELRNRFADNWRPLLSIADSLGWGEKARDTMMIFAREYRDADVKILLLADVRKVFDALGVDRLPSKTLLNVLHELDESDWCEFHGTRGGEQPHKLRHGELTAMLRAFKIRTHSIWPRPRTPDSQSAKGYRRPDFEAAWATYCGNDDTPAHGSNIKSLRVIGDDT